MSDWQDPFADDEAAREREARRAEREARRRGEETRESLGERVRSGIDEEPSRPADLLCATAARPTSRQLLRRRRQPRSRPFRPRPLPRCRPPRSSPPRRRHRRGRPTSDAVHRRRMFALVGLGLLIIAVAAIGTIISRGGDSSSEASGVPTAKKTIEVVVPEGYDRTQIAEVAKKAGPQGRLPQGDGVVQGLRPGQVRRRERPEPGGLPVPRHVRALQGREGGGPRRKAARGLRDERDRDRPRGRGRGAWAARSMSW